MEIRTIRGVYMVQIGRIRDLGIQKFPFFASFLEFSIYENEIIIVKFILTYN